jgi:hypothetical protein
MWSTVRPFIQHSNDGHTVLCYPKLFHEMHDCCVKIQTILIISQVLRVILGGLVVIVLAGSRVKTRPRTMDF